jgi:tRNA (cytidine56-2'-O)-methyltransferase
MLIEILRLGHRLPRDERISTHVALVARAFGASAIAYTGQHDSGLEESVERICGRWGGDVSEHGGGGDGGEKKFSISYEKSAVSFIKSKKRDGFAIVHLTMYGMPVMDRLKEMKSNAKILVVVGSEQVPPEIYQLADHNISVTNQPHSEVAALAITLDRLVDGKELLTGDSGFDFKGQIDITPSERGKNIKEKKVAAGKEL